MPGGSNTNSSLPRRALAFSFQQYWLLSSSRFCPQSKLRSHPYLHPDDESVETPEGVSFYASFAGGPWGS